MRWNLKIFQIEVDAFWIYLYNIYVSDFNIKLGTKNQNDGTMYALK